jgi:drug/metabolite transporter (DMT)-like permease
MLPADLSLLISLLALLAAMSFACGTLMVKRGLQHTDSVTGAVIQIGTSMVIFGLAAPFFVSGSDWLSPAVWVFAAVGLARPSFSTILANEGTRRLGPTLSSTFESLSPLFAVMGGAAFLAEQLTPAAVLGTLGVVAGVVVLTARGRLTRSWRAWALAFPLGAALIRSAAHVAARWGLLMLPNVILSGAVAYTVSFAVAFGVNRVRRRPAPRAPLTRGVLWFVGSGTSNAAAIFALNSALMLGPVVQVSPLVATYPLFTLLGGRLLYRQEPITGRMLLAVALIVPSVILITMAHR